MRRVKKNLGIYVGTIPVVGQTRGHHNDEQVAGHLPSIQQKGGMATSAFPQPHMPQATSIPDPAQRVRERQISKLRQNPIDSDTIGKSIANEVQADEAELLATEFKKLEHTLPDIMLSEEIEKKRLVHQYEQAKRENPNEPVIIAKKIDAPVPMLAKNTSATLLNIKAVWPFDFFPSELIVEEQRIILNYRTFFFTSEIVTILISDIAFCEISRSLFFASINIQNSFGIDNTIKWLKNADAMKAKELIDGLQIKTKSGIEVNEASMEERKKAYIKIGHSDAALN